MFKTLKIARKAWKLTRTIRKTKVGRKFSPFKTLRLAFQLLKRG